MVGEQRGRLPFLFRWLTQKLPSRIVLSEKLNEARGLEVCESGDDSICARVDPAKGKTSEDLSAAIFAMAVDKNLVVQELKIEEGRLDDIFRQVTESDI